MTIYKYKLKPEDFPTVLMPEGARLLHVAGQHNEVCVWADVDLDKPERERVFACVATGDSPPTEATYVGTALIYSGDLVIHVYDYGYGRAS